MTFVADNSPGAPSAVDPTDRAGRLAGRVSVGQADTLSAGANVTAPAAGANVVNLAAPPAGSYEVRIAAAVGAGAVAADNGNVQLKKGAAVVLTNLPTTGAEQALERVTLDGATALTLVAVGAATAGVVYTGRISATRTE